MPAVAANLIVSLDRSMVAPTVLFAHEGIYAMELRAKGIPVSTLGKRTPFFWRIKRYLMNWFLLIHARQFDVIHIHSIKLEWSVLVASWLGVKVVFHLHELPRRIGWVLRAAVAAADCVVFCSETCAAHFINVPARKRRVIVNAMCFPDNPPVLHVDTGLKVVMVGSINKNKGQDILLRSFACLKNSAAELWLYGTIGLSAHKYVHNLKRFVKKMKLGGRVYFPGPTGDVYQVFAGTSVMVHTSLTESFGMALVEAQACGVPVIAHDLEGMREVVVDGITGYLIARGDVDALRERLDQLLSSSVERNRLGREGYVMVRDRFSIKARLPEYLSLYQEVCKR